MKKVTVNISYDEEKLNALKLYLKQKDMNLDAELTKSLDTLFNKTVPSGVREFIDMKSGTMYNPMEKPVRSRKSSPSSAADTDKSEARNSG